MLCCVALRSVSGTFSFVSLVLQMKPPALDNPLCVRLQKLISTLQSYAAVTLKVGLLFDPAH